MQPSLRINIEDPVALTTYLRRAGHIPPHLQPRIHPLAGGVSNRTVLVEVDAQTRWVLKQALAQLRVQVEWFSDPRRIAREALGLRLLPLLTPPGTIPRLIFEDPEQHLLAMAAVDEPHVNWKQQLLVGQVEPGQVQQFAQILGQIHARYADHAALVAPLLTDHDDQLTTTWSHDGGTATQDLPALRELALTRPQVGSFFESLRLEPYYHYTAQQAPEAAPFFHALIAETRRLHLAVVHGDYSPKNILIYAGQLILLDHEVIHWGDPAFDVGFAMTHLLSKAHYLVAHRTHFLTMAGEFWTTYQRVVGDRFGVDLEPRAARHLMACLLARVLGRSPLEYLDAAARDRQQRAVLQMIARPPACIPALIAAFAEEIAP
jgi:aminoglycoside phosphotransferase (APT) family kinase protein